jgi:predicted aldo/keto reductase-like oxidoreductase
VCPHGVPVADILRYKMYFEDYGEEKFAMQRYALLPASARPSRCAGCDAPCEDACPYGLRVRDRLSEADRQLRFA